MIKENPLSLLSKYRSALMGLAILGVLIGHIYDLGGADKTNPVYNLLYWLFTLIHVNGFLFLSGFGIFYSLKGNSSTKVFYTKRIYRIVIPYLLLAVPYFLLFTVAKHESMGFFFRCITTAEFWVNGNFHGMWYIALSLVLYLITPPIYYFISKNSLTMFWGLLIAVIISILIDIILEKNNSEYHSLIGIGTSRIHLYFLGMMFGLFTKESLDHKLVIGMCTVLSVLYGLTFISSYFAILSFYGIIPLLFWLMICCIVLYSIQNITKDTINRFFSWFGKYSLELYILHLFLWTILKFGMHTEPIYIITTANVLAIVLCKPVNTAISFVNNVIKSRIH